MEINIKKERLTSQKKFVLNYLKSVKSHPSAEKIYLEVQKKLPRISRGTVYRILKNLKEKEKIQEISCRVCNNVCRYDGDTSSHSHFFCEKCKNVYDVFEKIDIKKHKKLKVGKINNYLISYYGICKNCQKK